MTRAFSAEADKPSGDLPVMSGNDILVGSSIQAAINAAANSDRILIPPGFYDEAVVVPVTLSNIILAVLGGKGSVAIKPSATDAVALTAHGPGTYLDGITGTGNGTGGGIILTGRGIRAKRCKGEGGAFGWTVEPNPAELGDMSGAVLDAYNNPVDDGSDIELEDCEEAWATDGFIIGGAIGAGVTELRIIRQRCHDCTNSYFKDGAGPAFSGLSIEEPIFCVNEDGTTPTTITDLDRTGNTGQIVNGRFSLAGGSMATLVLLAAGVANISPLAANAWYIPVGGVIDFGAGDVTITHSADALTLAGGQFFLPDGTFSLPALAFASSPTIGMYASGVGEIAFGNTSGSWVAQIVNAVPALNLRTTAYLSWGADTYLGWESIAVIQQGLDAASPVTQTFKGADARAGTDNNAVGGVMRLASGRSTGNAVPGIVALQGTAATVTTGTGAQTLIDRFIPNAFKVLANNVATAVLNVAVASATATGGKIVYQIEVTDGTDYQSEVGEVFFNTQNDGAAIVGTITEVNSQQAISAGGSTLATTWAMTNANPAVISVNANSSLTPSTGYPRITFAPWNGGQQGISIP